MAPALHLAARVAAAELVLLILVAVLAERLVGWDWMIPAAIAAPLIGIQLWFDMRSRSRRLLPELCGAVGIAATAASLGLAGGTSTRLAIALWLILAARAVASIPFVRTQIRRLHHVSVPTAASDLAQVVGLAVAVLAVVSTPAVAAGAGAVAALTLAQLAWTRRPPIPAKTLGLRQVAVGIALVVITTTGVLAA